MRLVDMTDGPRPALQAFVRGWAAGAAYFLVATWWVSEAFYVDAAAHAWQAPFAVAALAGGLALFWGAAAAVYRRLPARPALRAVVFAAVFAFAEWTRGHIFTGFPWDLPGEAWPAGGAVSQAAALFGAYGLSFATLAASALLASAAGPGATRVRVGQAALALALLGGAAAFGAARLAGHPEGADSGREVRIVQPDFYEQPDYDARSFREIVTRYAAMTAAPSARRADIVVWPEGAIPAAVNDYLAPGAWTREAIGAALAPGQTLLVGAFRVSGPPSDPEFHNTLAAIRNGLDGPEVTAIYDKHRLVPFGEYLPLKGVLKPLGFAKLVNVSDGFTPGPAPQAIDPPGTPAVQPLICYEALFPGFTGAGARRAGRPAWIVNVSDDAWFGRTYGPLQHLNLARYRAIEEGLPMARATPTGVSAMIDPLGRVRAGESLGQDRRGVIDAPLPPPLPATPYARFGDLPFGVAVWAALLVGLRFAARRRAAT